MLESGISFKMENHFQKVPKTSNSSSSTSDLQSFEYKGYHKFGRVLGRGTFGTVIECERKADNLPIALKFFKCSGIHKWIPEHVVIASDEKEHQHSEFLCRKSNMSHNHSDASSSAENRVLPSEVACLIRASHISGVVKILDYLPASEEVHIDQDQEINDENVIGIVLERNPNEICLFDYLIKRQMLNENDARFIIKQLVKINLDLLQAGILHGDLKSENILIDPKTLLIKLIDFGSAQLIESSPQQKSNKSNVTKSVKTFRGTNLYKPPEYLMNKCFYPRPSTVWTIGIILYDMVFGMFPFRDDSEIIAYKNKELKFLSNIYASASLKNLIKSCLAFYVADRICIDNILSDQWITASH